MKFKPRLAHSREKLSRTDRQFFSAVYGYAKHARRAYESFLEEAPPGYRNLDGFRILVAVLLAGDV